MEIVKVERKAHIRGHRFCHFEEAKWPDLNFLSFFSLLLFRSLLKWRERDPSQTLVFGLYGVVFTVSMRGVRSGIGD